MKKNLGFRSWYYFRMGWSTYFAFIFAAANTLVTTYYLAIDKLESLKIIFPSFGLYVVVWILIGIPLLVAIGYIHYKKTPAYAAETEVSQETNPYCYKLLPGYNTDVLFPMYLLMMEILVKLSKNEKLSDEELQKLSKLEGDLQILINGGYIGKYRDNKTDANQYK